MDGRWLESYPKGSPGAFGSGELINNKRALGPWVAHLRMTDQWTVNICEIFGRVHYQEQECKIILNSGQGFRRCRLKD